MLRGIGAAVALPWMESLIPSSILGSNSASANVKLAQPPTRMAFLYVPNGMHMPAWTPEQEGRGFEVPEILKPLAKYRSEMTILSGLTLNGARALGDGGGDHARSVAAYLTGAHPKKTDGSDIENGKSVDQVYAEARGNETKLRSLELGLERSAQAGRCDSGYSCVYVSNMSWRTETAPVAKEINPQAVFDRLIGSTNTQENLKTQSKRLQYKKSILDFVSEDAQQLQRSLSTSDQRKLDEYLYSIREVERNIVGTEKLDRNKGLVDFDRPDGVPADWEDHVKILLDLMTLAFQTDSTRVSTFMFTNAGSNRSYKNIDVPDGHHNISHHGQDQEKLEKIQRINTYHASLFTHLIDRLSHIEEADGTLLDHCMVMYGSGIGDGNRHNHHDLPIAMLGRGNGAIKPGRHIRYDSNTPLTNLYLSMLNSTGLKVDKFGDSTGRLEGLDG